MSIPIFAELDARTREAEAFWEHEHGPWLAPGEWPRHPKPPCYYCWQNYRHGSTDRLEDIRRATTFIDRHEGRYTVCEEHWRKGMREVGYSDEEIRRILVEQGGFSEEQADTMLAERN